MQGWKLAPELNESSVCLEYLHMITRDGSQLDRGAQLRFAGSEGGIESVLFLDYRVSTYHQTSPSSITGLNRRYTHFFRILDSSSNNLAGVSAL